MNSKFIIIGDPHFKTSNVPDTDDFIKKIKTLASSQKPDFIIILGDVLHEHERLHTIPLNKAYEFISTMSDIASTYILVGNHDMINNQQFLTHNHWMNGMKEWPNVQIIDTPTNLNHNGKQYVFCPYVPNGRFEEALNTMTDDWKTANLIFAHQEFIGCKMGAIISQDGDIWDKSQPPIISGHIHSNQLLLDGHIYYPGSAMQNALGDPNNIITIINTEIDNLHQFDDDNDFKVVSTRQLGTNSYRCDEVDLMLRKKKIVSIDLDKIDELNVSKLLSSVDQLKLSLVGNYDDFKVFVKTPAAKTLLNAGIKIVHKNKKNTKNTNPQLDPDQDTDQDTDQEQNPGQPQDLPDILGSLDTLDQLVYNSVTKESNPYVTSDFNYVFLSHEKDEEIIVL